jgi:hypothetical protein
MRHHHESRDAADGCATNVLFIKMDYDDFQSASADLALLAKDGASITSTAAEPAGRPVAWILRRRRRLL